MFTGLLKMRVTLEVHTNITSVSTRKAYSARGTTTHMLSSVTYEHMPSGADTMCG